MFNECLKIGWKTAYFCILNFSFKNHFVWEVISSIQHSVSSPEKMKFDNVVQSHVERARLPIKNELFHILHIIIEATQHAIYLLNIKFC